METLVFVGIFGLVIISRKKQIWLISYDGCYDNGVKKERLFGFAWWQIKKIDNYGHLTFHNYDS